MRVRTRNVAIAVTYVCLFAVAVPWYWELWGADPVRPLVLGTPRWFALSILVSLVISIFTALVITRWWPGSASDTA
ncbi:MAG: hypothetical protein GTO41_03205 [Burkholderiales bacterium]|nr:hypothetical protein [Burkholderiales bacterium]